MDEKMAEEGVLLWDGDGRPVSPEVFEKECKALEPILKEFVTYYAAHKDEPVEEWLSRKMQEHFPEKPPEEIAQWVDEIVTTLKTNEENRASLDEAVSRGRSKESWFASVIRKATSKMSPRKTEAYLQGLDDAVKNANDSMYKTITTQAGVVSQNPRLDGFIAEQHHAQTFNMNAKATGSSYRAKVLEPSGSGYAKNSVDIVIVDDAGKVVRRYQSKYGKDAQTTAELFEHGDYRGQRKLVPSGQEGSIGKKATAFIEAPDGTKSKPLTKEQAKQMQGDAQRGNPKKYNYNDYAVKDVALNIGKQAGYAAVQGAAISVGVEVAQKLWNGEEIEGEEVVKSAISGGVDFGVKAAAAGALKVGAEKGILSSVIPKNTPAGICANIAHVAIENVKVVGKIVSGDLTVREGLEEMGRTTVSTVAGIAASGKGTAIGAAIGTVFGPVGTAVGGFIGGTVGFMAGSTIGKAVVSCAKKVKDVAVGVVKTVGSVIKGAVSAVTNFVGDLVGGLFGW